jgi:hypothetical protein
VPARLIAEWSGRIIAQGRQGVGAISTLQFLPRILTRSLHLPVAVVEGSLTQNFNKTAVPSEAIPPSISAVKSVGANGSIRSRSPPNPQVRSEVSRAGHVLLHEQLPRQLASHIIGCDGCRQSCNAITESWRVGHPTSRFLRE